MPAEPTPSASQPAQPPAAAVDDGPELELEVTAPVDPEAIIAARRRKRAEILAKYAAASVTPASSTAVSEASTRPTTPALAELARAHTPAAEASTPGREDMERGAKRLKLDSPAVAEGEEVDADVFDLAKDAEATLAREAGEADASTHLPGEEEVSAADYNPDEDRKEDDRRHAERAAAAEAEAVGGKHEVKREVMVVQDEEDDDDDDMFSMGHKVVLPDPGEGGDGKAAFVPVINRAAATEGLVDNYDDGEGYYKLLLGELLDEGRYHVVANLGKGMFSGVVRARDLGEGGKGGTGEEVAIKVIRSQESMCALLFGWTLVVHRADSPVPVRRAGTRPASRKLPSCASCTTPIPTIRSTSSSFFAPLSTAATSVSCSRTSSEPAFGADFASLHLR